MIMIFRLFISCMLMLAAGAVEAEVDHLGAVQKLAPHPRILWAPGQEKVIRQRIASDATARKVHDAMLAECDRLMDESPLQRQQVGKRLLDVSREAFRRIFFLSYAYRISGEEKYLARAEKEMLAIAEFRDWNPSHFLDVAEMTMGMAIGYDWLHEGLSTSSRRQIKDAIIGKALDISFMPEYSDWTMRTNNWNQVCNAGMVFGAMATYGDEPAKAKRIINRAINSIVLPMHEYAPDGIYPEGYSYWSYGTTFNVLLISALEGMFGTDFGLLKQPGFLKSAEFIAHMVGATNKAFNFGDSGSGAGFSSAAVWLAQRQNDPSLLWAQHNFLQKSDMRNAVKSRYLPTALLWMGAQNLASLSPPKAKAWIGRGSSPVALFRTSWTDPDAIYVGVKGGTPSANHGHMDAGSFVMEADGVRWAIDLGMQNYESLESRKVDLWNLAQNSQRWDVFALNNFSHNTLTVNGQLQRVDGLATLSDFSDDAQHMGVTVDLGSLYSTTLKAAHRRIAVEKQALVTVRDQLQAGDQDASVRWAMLTPATVKLISSHRAELTKDGKKLIVEVRAPAGITLTTWPTTPAREFDAPNPDITLLGFESPVKAGAKATLEVQLLTSRAAGFE